MKKLHLIAGSICALALGTATVGGFMYLTELHTPPPATVPATLRQQLRTGDILFSEGHSLKSNLARLTGRNEAENEVSHTGFIQRRGETLFVTHMSIDDGRMMSEQLDTFIRRNRVGRLYFTRLHTPFNQERLALVLDSLLSLRQPLPYGRRHGILLYRTECQHAASLRLLHVRQPLSPFPRSALSGQAHAEQRFATNLFKGKAAPFHTRTGRITQSFRNQS